MAYKSSVIQKYTYKLFSVNVARDTFYEASNATKINTFSRNQKIVRDDHAGLRSLSCLL